MVGQKIEQPRRIRGLVRFLPSSDRPAPAAAARMRPVPLQFTIRQDRLPHHAPPVSAAHPHIPPPAANAATTRHPSPAANLLQSKHLPLAQDKRPSDAHAHAAGSPAQSPNRTSSSPSADRPRPQSAARPPICSAAIAPPIRSEIGVPIKIAVRFEHRRRRHCVQRIGRQLSQTAASRANARASCSRDTVARHARESPASAASSRAAPASESRAASRPVGQHGGRPLRPRQRRQLAEDFARPSCTVPVCSKQPRHILQKHARRVRPLARVPTSCRSPQSCGPTARRTSGSREFCHSCAIACRQLRRGGSSRPSSFGSSRSSTTRTLPASTRNALCP